MKPAIKIIIIIGIMALAVAFPAYAGTYLLSIALVVLNYLTLAVSWDMLLRSGQLSFGMAGFFGIGAYGAALSFLNLHIHPLLSIIIGGALSFIVAMLIGFSVLRLRGMYFAIVTLAISEIFKVIVRNWTGFTGGPEGESLPSVIFGGNSAALYWLMLCIALFTILVSFLFQKTRLHFALTAIRNNEIVAQSSGINIYLYLVIAFSITSGLQGLAGGAFSQIYGFVTPEGCFSADYILLPIAMALLGGIYSTTGPIIGALLLGIVGEYLKLVIPYGHQVVYGVIVVLVILFMPRGIVGLIRQKTAKEM